MQVVKCQTEDVPDMEPKHGCLFPSGSQGLSGPQREQEQELRPSAPERSGSALIRRPTESPDTVDNRASGDTVDPAAVNRKPQPRRGGERPGGCQRPEPLRHL